MNTIKKTTLIAAITAMAAFAVPAMASAAVWGPINTNKTLTSTSSARYITQAAPAYSFECANSTLGVHVRTPASSTLDITSASFTNCVTPPPFFGGCYPTVTATGLPWAATATGSSVSFTEHLLVTYTGACGTFTVNVDGPFPSSYSNATHSLTGQTPSSAPFMTATVMGTYFSGIGGGFVTTWKDTTNTLTLT